MGKKIISFRVLFFPSIFSSCIFSSKLHSRARARARIVIRWSACLFLFSSVDGLYIGMKGNCAGGERIRGGLSPRESSARINSGAVATSNRISPFCGNCNCSNFCRVRFSLSLFELSFQTDDRCDEEGRASFPSRTGTGIVVSFAPHATSSVSPFKPDRRGASDTNPLTRA